MIKNKVKYVAMGMVIGSIVTMSSQGFANTPINPVTAFVSNLIQFDINGEKAELPSDYEVLIYKDRTYVPVRFISEQLGAIVDWNDDTKVIKIESQIKEEKPTGHNSDSTVDDNTQEDEIKKDYKKIPVTYNDIDMLLGISAITETDDEWKVHMILENKGTTPLQIQPGETKIVVDGKEYFMKDVPLNKLDTKWYSDVREEERLEGYISLPKLHKDPQKLDLKVTVLKNDGRDRKNEVEFNILLDK
ncbi:MAG: hypothetical protein K0R93_519 [Anaerosolibacter sp.]|uniref:copper amine oxidase N-terminal domain-containing protein n=1 Tax=Anaerosolibacter sp. TaxID=1872527 RepID=UPI0026040BCE|nr:copper amine oxidase N-terminal domain-containing protein [Anaerosolibacter sp.]MDF2545621.1 hypothetical protein [Anaerosolibacter sp.]